MARSGSVLQMLLPLNFCCIWNIHTIILLYFLVIVKTEDLQLKLVQLIIRHGDRSPIQTYPSDPWKNAWPDGFGQLTNLGMQQQYQTGQFFRNRYEKLINDSNNYDIVYVQSTDIERNLMSASANLAGFFPPEGTRMWKKNICWEPIPIHTVPSKEDYLLSFFATCPHAENLYRQLLNSSKANSIKYKYRDLFKYLARETSHPVTEVRHLHAIADSIFVQNTHNLSMPEWANETILADLERLMVNLFNLLVKTPGISRLRGGPFIGETVKKMEKVIDSRSDQYKIYLFLSHDITIATILSALNIYEPHIPPYCSTIMVELFEGSGNYYVKILYRNDTSRDPYELSLKGCSSLCPFDKFKKLTSSIIPVDLKSECII